MVFAGGSESWLFEAWYRSVSEESEMAVLDVGAGLGVVCGNELFRCQSVVD